MSMRLKGSEKVLNYERRRKDGIGIGIGMYCRVGVCPRLSLGVVVEVDGRSRPFQKKVHCSTLSTTGVRFSVRRRAQNAIVQVSSTLRMPT